LARTQARERGGPCGTGARGLAHWPSAAFLAAASAIHLAILASTSASCCARSSARCAHPARLHSQRPRARADRRGAAWRAPPARPAHPGLADARWRH
jgi:hypothetical protein